MGEARAATTSSWVAAMAVVWDTAVGVLLAGHSERGGWCWHAFPGFAQGDLCPFSPMGIYGYISYPLLMNLFLVCFSVFSVP